MNAPFHLFHNLWDGVFTTDFKLDHVRRRCYRLGRLLLARSAHCIVAYDTRFMSNLFAQDVYHYLRLQGVSVSLVPTPVPLPALQSAVDRQQGQYALYVSARNRPYWYNGLVLLGATDPELSLTASDADPTGEDQFSLQRFPASSEQIIPGQDFAAESTLDVRKPYLDMVRTLIDVNIIRRVPLTIFADPMHGSLASYLPAIIGEGSQTKAIEINREIDPLFNKITPLPTTSALSRMCKLVRESDSNVGLAFSADGTILGVVDKNGIPLEQIEIVLLLASYLSNQYRQKGIVIAPPPAAGSPFAHAGADLNSWEEALGFKVELNQHATERLTSLIAGGAENLLVGCTNEGELLLNRYCLYPDALVAGLLMIEIIARGGGALRPSRDDLRELLAVRE